MDPRCARIHEVRAARDFPSPPPSARPATPMNLPSDTTARTRSAPLQAVRGMNDVLPDEAALWLKLEDASRRVFALYGYRNLRVPLVEYT